MTKLEDLAGSKGILLHHWDTDGLTSAAIIQRHCQAEFIHFTPTIGNYYLNETDLAEIRASEPEFIIVADMSLPEASLLALANIALEVLVLDHHAGKPVEGITLYNPVIDGKEPDDYPSAGWAINEYLDQEQNILSVIGAIGDRACRMKENYTVQAVLEQAGISFEDALELVKNLDSNYIMNDRVSIHRTVDKIMARDIGELLHDSEMLSNRKSIEAEIKRLHTIEPKQDGQMLIYKIDTEYHLISRFTRELAVAHPDNLIMTVDAVKGALYVRRTNLDIDLSALIPWGKERGYHTGGKREVLGVQSEKHDIVEVIEGLSQVIGGMLNDL